MSIDAYPQSDMTSNYDDMYPDVLKNAQEAHAITDENGDIVPFVPDVEPEDVLPEFDPIAAYKSMNQNDELDEATDKFGSYADARAHLHMPEPEADVSAHALQARIDARNRSSLASSPAVTQSPGIGFQFTETNNPQPVARHEQTRPEMQTLNDHAVNVAVKNADGNNPAAVSRMMQIRQAAREIEKHGIN